MRTVHRLIPAVAIVVLPVFLQGCLLSIKRVQDTYISVAGSAVGEEKIEITLLFPRQYCIPAGSIQWQGRLKQMDPVPSAGLVAFRHYNSSWTLVSQQFFSMTLMPTGAIPLQTSSYPGDCFEAGDWLQISSKWFGAGIQAGAQFAFNIGYPNLRGETRTLQVKVKGGRGALGKVVLDPPDLDGKSECALPGDNPKKNQNTCLFFYEENTVVTATAMPESGSIHQRWGDACDGVPAGDPCEVTMDTDKGVFANFDPGPNGD